MYCVLLVTKTLITKGRKNTTKLSLVMHSFVSNNITDSNNAGCGSHWCGWDLWHGRNWLCHSLLSYI